MEGYQALNGDGRGYITYGYDSNPNPRNKLMIENAAPHELIPSSWSLVGFPVAMLLNGLYDVWMFGAERKSKRESVHGTLQRHTRNEMIQS